jgi:hypothetical protein
VSNSRSKRHDEAPGPSGEGTSHLASAAEWESYLRDLAIPRGPLSAFFVKQIQDAWSHIERSVAGVAPPHATITPDQGFAMAWDRGRHHFEVEIEPGSRYGWFYMDRASDLRAGEEGRTLGLYAPEMISFLRRTVA